MSTKKRRVGVNKPDLPSFKDDPASQYAQAQGLRGYGKSGARVSQILSELNAKSLLEKAQNSQQNSTINSSLSKEKARAMANINEGIIKQVESMIETKKKPEKVFNNNPPKKEVPQKSGAVDNEAVEKAWNTHFTGKGIGQQNNNQPNNQQRSRSRGKGLQYNRLEQTLDSESLDYNTGAMRIAGRQSLMSNFNGLGEPSNQQRLYE